MDPAGLIPTPDAIPVHWAWFQLLLLITFFLHILLMNVMLGTAVIAFVKHLSPSSSSERLTSEISRKLPFSIALAVNFGVAPLLFVQVLYGHFIYVSSVLMAALWLSVIGILIAAYYTAYIYRYQYQAMDGGRTTATALISVLLLIIGFFFSANFTLMLHPDAWPKYFSHPSAMLVNLADPTLVPRYLHFTASALAVGGLAIALYFTMRRRHGEAGTEQWIRCGCNWFAYATFANFAIGLWFFDVLPEGLIRPNTTVGFLFTLFLVIGIVCGLLAVISAMRLRVMAALYLLLPAIFAMILVREFLRVASLAPWFSLPDLEVAPAYSPLVLFLLFFIGGVVLIGWMLKTAHSSFQNKEVQP